MRICVKSLPFYYIMKKFGLNDKLTFGKYRGKTIQEVIAINSRYMEWVEENVEWLVLGEDVTKALNEREDCVLDYEMSLQYGDKDGYF